MANIVDYNALQQAKTNTNSKFDEMLQNLENMKNQVVQMNESSWKGSSGNVFEEIFTEIKAKINSERSQFNGAIDDKLTFWYNEFTEEEKTQISAAQGM